MNENLKISYRRNNYLRSLRLSRLDVEKDEGLLVKMLGEFETQAQ